MISLPFKDSWIQVFKDYLAITFGLFLYSVGFDCFQLPYQITPGGVAGAGAVIFYGTGFPVIWTFLSVNVILLAIAIRVLGTQFCIKTIYAVIMLSLLIWGVKTGLIDYAHTHPGIFDLSPQGLPQIVKNDAFMSAILGASFEGIGLGIIFLASGSTGGTDIIAAIVNKYKDVTLGQMIMLTDLLIISSSILLPQIHISQLLYGYCTLIISNILIDFVIDRGRQSVQFFIFSNKYDEIATAISSTGRGVTVLYGEGWYTHAPRKVLVVLAKKRESTTIFRFIQSIDPAAFVTQSKVIGVFGQGFDRIKVKDKAKKNKEAKNQPQKTIS